MKSGAAMLMGLYDAVPTASEISAAASGRLLKIAKSISGFFAWRSM